MNIFVLSDAEENPSRLLNRRGTADSNLLRTLLAICQKSQEPSVWELMDSFALLAYASLAALRPLLQWLLACLNFYFRFRRFIIATHQKSDFHELWQHTSTCKPWRWVRLDLIFTMRDIYINSNLKILTKFIRSSKSRI